MDDNSFGARLAAALRETLRCGDSVLFKASNRMDLKKVIELTGIS